MPILPPGTPPPQQPPPFFQQASGAPQSPMAGQAAELAENFGANPSDPRFGLYRWILQQAADPADPDNWATKELQKLEIQDAEIQKRAMEGQ